MTEIVNCRNEVFDVYIGRPSKWGNPFKIGRDGNREEVIEKYGEWLIGAREAPGGEERPALDEAKQKLRGKRLGCYCRPRACHGDVLKKFVDGGRSESRHNKTN